MMVILNNNEIGTERKLADKQIDELFEVSLKPLKSKSARAIFNIFVKKREVNSLTSLDLQSNLATLEIDLSKKEINNWLHSLDDARLIEKEEKRGKPTTMPYDDKYTFDLWSLTPKGMEISEGIENILRGKERRPYILPIERIKDVAKQDHEATKQILNTVEEFYILHASLRSLLRATGATSLKELKENMKPQGKNLERTISSCIDQGLVVKVDTPQRSRLLSMFLRLIGFTMDVSASFKLTKEGRILAEKINIET